MIRYKVFIIPFLVISSCVNAGQIEGKIKEVNIRSGDGLIWIVVDGKKSNKPNCAENWDAMIIKNEKSIEGKQQLAALLSAQASNKTVSIFGSNECTRWSDGEDINLVRINSN